jgi:hypothetical protein
MAAALWIKIGAEQGEQRQARVWDEKLQAYVTPKYEKGHAKAGRPMIERLPALGHDGTDIHNMRKMRGVKRYSTFLRHDGHEVSIPLTNAAAHVPAEDTSYARDRYLKARHFGWIEQGKCPLIMVASGDLLPELVESADLMAKGAQPCHPADIGADKPPCEHYLAEKRARKLKNDQRHSEREAAHESEQAKHTKALETMTAKVADAVVASMAGKPEAKAGK